MPGKWLDRVRNALWPRMGLRRYGTYLRKKVLRLSASPHAIGAGVASGAAVSMFPLIGLHFLLGFVLAFVTRGNMIAAAIGTAWGNPLTFPLFFAASFQIGTWLTGGVAAGDQAVNADAASDTISQGLFSAGFETVWPAFRTMMIGALPLAIIVYVAFYVVVRWLVVSFRTGRQARLAGRRHAAGEQQRMQ